MYICVCNAITEEEIKEHLSQGGILEVITKTRAATTCGLCLEEIEQMEERLNAPQPTPTITIPIVK